MNRSLMISELIFLCGDESDQINLKRIEYCVVELAKEYGAARVSFFGSFARGD